MKHSEFVRPTSSALARMPELARFRRGIVETLGGGVVEVVWEGTDRVSWMREADVEVIE